MSKKSNYRSNEYGEENEIYSSGKSQDTLDARKTGSRGKTYQRSQGEEGFYEDGTFTGLSFRNRNHIDDDDISALPSIKGIEDVWTATEDIESQRSRRRSNDIAVEDVDSRSLKISSVGSSNCCITYSSIRKALLRAGSNCRQEGHFFGPARPSIETERNFFWYCSR